MTQIDLGKIKPIWKGDWATGTAYEKNDMVKHGVNSYIATAAHTAGATFAGDSASWDTMATGADIPPQSGNSGKALVTDGSTLSWGDGGKVLQVKTASANYDFGSISNTQPYHCGWLDITIIAQKTNAKYFLSGRIPTDDTNENSYGVGMGFSVYNNTTLAHEYIQRPSNHEDYNAGGFDTYKICQNTILWDSSVATGSTPANIITEGNTVTFRLWIRNNNNNMKYFNGNETSYHNQWHQVWELS